ncbi:MAG: hypothetical protein ACI4GA_07860 [Acutalibacteraceae bacterium]|nr:hypothetical protein [Oscillospiraceae bacterium]
MTSSDVYSQLLLIVTPEESEGTDKILSLCDSALDWVMRKKLPEISDDDSRIPYAAAAVAYYNYALSRLTDSNDPRNFKAGDVSVKKDIREDLLVAEKLKASRLAEVSDIFTDTQFGAWNV